MKLHRSLRNKITVCVVTFLASLGLQVLAATRSVVPNADGEGLLGHTNKQWETLYVGGIVVGGQTRITNLATALANTNTITLAAGTGITVRSSSSSNVVTWIVDNTFNGFPQTVGAVLSDTANSTVTYSALSGTTIVDQAGFIPARATQMMVKAWGAGGGGGANSAVGGAGGFALSSALPCTPNTPYWVRVGQKGYFRGTNISSQMGGGAYFVPQAYNYHGAGGGGASAFLWNTNFDATSAVSITNFLVIAGGGGGAGCNGAGGAGGGLVGSSGGGFSGGAGTGGSQTNGGVQGVGTITNTAASFLLGQYAYTAGSSAGTWSHGAGGGGYYGGGCGGVSNASSGGAGGGGGSGYGFYTVSGNNTSDPDWASGVGAAGAAQGAGGNGSVKVFFWLSP